MKKQAISRRYRMTITFAALALIPMAGCSTDPDPAGSGSLISAFAGDVCAPDESQCPPPPCDDTDPACPPPPCSPGDPECPPIAICDPMPVEVQGDCDLFWGWAWNGSACVPLSGCECQGDCALLYGDPDACAIDHEGCDGTIDPDCNVLAAELGTLLAEAQACNVASMSPSQCNYFVPTISGCSQPTVSEEAAKPYLDLFAVYAAHCPLTDPPCPDPSTLSTGCVQGPDVDSLIGQCAIVDDGSVDDADL
jgi:hypothetical protein